MRSANYTIVFAVVLSIVCSIMLSGVYMGLKDQQDDNRALEQKMCILAAAQIATSSKTEAKGIYQSRVKGMVINDQGEVMDNIDPSTIDETCQDRFLLFAISESSESTNIVGYVYPVVGSGLWSKLYGYLAVDKTGKNVLGITFYKQGETPGLGAEIEKPWFVMNFQGKTLFDGEKLVGIKIAKGQARLDPAFKYSSDRIVDGISGATITGDGITDMLLKEPQRYEPFFKKIRQEL